jgi:cysteine desulfurase
MRTVYFDSAATTQLKTEVIAEITNVMQADYGNPSSTHSYGRTAKSLIEKARKSVAKHLNVTAAEIIFTSGGTEADNLALNSAVRDLGVTTIITSKIEHHAVLYMVNQLKSQFNINVEYVDLDDCGHINYANLEELLNQNSNVLVSLMHINNEIGNILDIKRVGELCKTYNALFHSDTVQSVGHFKVDLQEINVDFIAVSAHKFHGPKGVGFAYVKKGSGIKPLIFGGEQERGSRAGTESVHNIVGLEKALDLSYQNLEEDKAYVSGLKKYFIDTLKKAIPEVSFNGNCSCVENSTYTLINVCLPVAPEKSPMLLFQLDLKGIACSKGSACQSGSSKGSHVLNEILSEEDMQKPSLRFSFSKFNTMDDIDYAVKSLTEIVNQ